MLLLCFIQPVADSPLAISGCWQLPLHNTFLLKQPPLCDPALWSEVCALDSVARFVDAVIMTAYMMLFDSVNLPSATTLCVDLLFSIMQAIAYMCSALCHTLQSRGQQDTPESTRLHFWLLHAHLIDAANRLQAATVHVTESVCCRARGMAR